MDFSVAEDSGVLMSGDLVSGTSSNSSVSSKVFVFSVSICLLLFFLKIFYEKVFHFVIADSFISSNNSNDFSCVDLMNVCSVIGLSSPWM